jgi:TPR repeat protein
MGEECLICSDTIDIEENYSLCCGCGIITCMDCGKKSDHCPFCRYKHNTKKSIRLKKLKQLKLTNLNKSAIYNAIAVCYILLDRKNYLEKAVEYFEKANTKISKKNIEFLIWLGIDRRPKVSDIKIDIPSLSKNINSLYYLNIQDKIWLEFLITKELYHARYFYANNYLSYIGGCKKYEEELEKLVEEGYIPAIYKLAQDILYSNKDKALTLLNILIDKGHPDACFYTYRYYIDNNYIENDYKEKAIFYLRKAYDLGCPKAERNLLKYYDNGKPNFYDIISKSPKKDFYMSKITRILKAEDPCKLKYDDDFY